MSTVLALADFLEYLRQRDFKVGVDHSLRAQILLDRFSQDYPSEEFLDSPGQYYPPDQLRSQLCALFATNSEEQIRFYKAFDEYVSYRKRQETVVGPQVEPRRPDRVKTNWTRPTIVAIVFAVIVLVMIVGPRLRTDNSQSEAESTSSPAFSPSETPIESPSAAETPAPGTSTPEAQHSPEQPSRQGAYAGVLGGGVLFFLLYEAIVYLWRRRHLGKEKSKTPPFSWPLHLPQPKVKLYSSDKFYQAVRRLRRRRIAPYHRLNVGATIAATIKSLGYPSFRYRPDSRIPEYLLLIERTSHLDHQAHLFDELFKSLKREGVYVTRYFYTSDPSICTDEAGRSSYHLSELKAKHFDNRLLIFGAGDKLLDPISGKLAEWLQIFSDWHERAVFTPVPPAQWSYREGELARYFSMLPANVSGLRELAGYFEPPITRTLGLWEHTETDVLPRELTPDNVVETLRSHLGEEVFQWLCACTLYPELRWGLTLQIGSLPVMKPGLINEDNLLLLARLPWFRVGTIPADIRWRLTEALDEEKGVAVRGRIVEWLEKDSPPPLTFAADKQGLELALQRWLLNRNANSLRQLLETLRRIPTNEILIDRDLVHHLRELPPPTLAKIFPRSMRPGLFRHGLPHFGLKSAFRALVMLVIVAFICSGIRAGVINEGWLPFAQPTPSPTPIMTPSPDLSPTPFSDGSPTPAVSPSPTPTPNASPTPSPSQTPTPSPTSERSPTPTFTPTPPSSPTPAVTASPTPRPSPTPTMRITASETALRLSCVKGKRPTNCVPSPSMTVKLSANVLFSPAPLSPLVYGWSVSGGRIIGQGPDVSWDLSGVGPGTYQASGAARDQGRLGIVAVSANVQVTVTECPCDDITASCPKLSVLCPRSIAAGKDLVFTARINEVPFANHAATQSSASYNWTVSAGKIKQGQGTPSIIVSTEGLQSQTITATVQVSGFPPTCDSRASCSTNIVGNVDSVKLQANARQISFESGKADRTVEFTSNPPGAKVTITPAPDNSSSSRSRPNRSFKVNGPTPNTSKLPVGPYEITFELNGQRVTTSLYVK